MVQFIYYSFYNFFLKYLQEPTNNSKVYYKTLEFKKALLCRLHKVLTNLFKNLENILK